MLELLIVVLLLYISYKLSKQEVMIQAQNELINSLRKMQDDCDHRVDRVEKDIEVRRNTDRELL